jgi:hypothetical protein
MFHTKFAELNGKNIFITNNLAHYQPWLTNMTNLVTFHFGKNNSSMDIFSIYVTCEPKCLTLMEEHRLKMSENRLQTRKSELKERK